MLRDAAFLSGAIVVTLLVHAYLYRRLIVDTQLSKRWRTFARVVSMLLAALLPGGMAGLLMMHDLARPIAGPLMWCAFGWVGVLLFLLPLTLVGEPLRSWMLHRATNGPVDPERRRAIARVIAKMSGVASLGLGGAAAITAELEPIVRCLEIPLPGIGERLDGFRIVQISDLHVGATIGGRFVECIVEKVNALSPDLIAITGDLVDGSVKELGGLLAPLARLRAREGVYFVTGNHEYLSSVVEWLEHLPSLGIRILRNERVRIGGDEGFDLIGIDDPSGASWVEGHGSDLPKALEGRDTRRPSVLLAHRPDDVLSAAAHGIGLQLSGHTHGGQIEPIGWVVERLRQPFVFGLYQVDGTTLYVTSGAGYWGPPMRLGTRAEIVSVELRRPS